MNIPKEHQEIMPYLILNNAQAFIDFMQNVFDAEENESMKSMRDDKTIMHAEIRIGGSTIMFTDSSDNFPVSNAGLFIYVDDADKRFKKAIDAGATIIMGLSDQSLEEHVVY